MTTRQQADIGGMTALGRPTLRSLSPDECYELIAAGDRAGGVQTADGPVVFPVNYAMAGQTVVLRTAADTELAARLDCRSASRWTGWTRH